MGVKVYSPHQSENVKTDTSCIAGCQPVDPSQAELLPRQTEVS